MTRISLSTNGSSPFERLIGHKKIVLGKWLYLDMVIFKNSSLSPELCSLKIEFQVNIPRVKDNL